MADITQPVNGATLTSSDQDTLGTEMQNTTAHGAAPRRRIATPAAAYGIFSKLRDDDSSSAAKRRAVIQGMIDGNPPYKQSELDEMGLGHLTNVNFMSMRANLDARAASGHELFAEVPTLIECYPLAVTQNNPDAHHFCSIIAEEFSDMVNQWDGFLPCMDMAWRDSDAYGLGVVVFENEWDWRPKAFRRGNLLFDAKSSVEVNRNDLLIVRDEMSASDMYELLEDEATSRDRGWNPTHMKSLLVKTFITGVGNDSEDKFQRSPWESLQQMVRNNDTQFQEKQFEKIRIVHLFVREVSGERKISHLIIPEASGEQVFLFEGYDQYERMSEAVWWMPYNYGDGLARSVRGVASFMVQHDDLSNRFLCRVFDAGFMTSSLLLQPASQMDLSRLQVTQFGPYTFLPAETKAVQSTFQPQISPLIDLRSVSEQVMKNNTGTYRQHGEDQSRGVEKTARQVVEETNKEARYEKAAIAFRYTNLDALYREMLRRVCLRDVLEDTEIDFPGGVESRAFFTRCKSRGVPPEFIYDWKEMFRVSAYRAIGLGSLSVKYDITNQLMQVSSGFDEAGKRAALRDWVSARVGHRNTDKYVAAINRDQITSNETSIATLEWNDAQEGSMIVAGSDQVHTIHIGVFVQGMVPIMQATEQMQVPDPPVALRTMQIAAQHIVQHLEFIAQEPRRKEFVKQVSDFLQQVGQAIQALTSMSERIASRQQEEQAQQQQTVADAEQIKRDRELELKIFEAQKRFEIDAMDKQNLNKNRDEKAAAQITLNRSKAAEMLKLKAELQAAEIAMKERETQADIALRQARGLK